MKKYKLPTASEPAGNAYYIMAMVVNAMKENGLENEVNDYLNDAKSSNYYHLREVSQKMLDRINNGTDIR